MFKKKINDILENEANLKIDSSTAQSEIEKIKSDLSKIEDVKAQLIIESGNSESVIKKLKSDIDSLEDKKVQIKAEIGPNKLDEIVVSASRTPERASGRDWPMFPKTASMTGCS